MENGNGENLFRIQPGETFVYPEDASDPRIAGINSADMPDSMGNAQALASRMEEIHDVIMEETARGAELLPRNGHNDPARDEQGFDETYLLPDFYPKEETHKKDFRGLTMINHDHPLFLPANLQIGIEAD